MQRTFLRGASSAAIALLLVGCGSPTTPTLTDPTAIISAAAATTAAATSVHVDAAIDGTVSLDLIGTGSGAPIRLNDTTAAADVDIAGGDLRATFAAPGLFNLAGELIRVDGTLYLKSSLTGPLYREFPAPDLPTGETSPEPSAVAGMLDGLLDLLAQPGIDPVKGDDVPCGTATCYTVEVELTPEEVAAMTGGAMALPIPIPSGLPIPMPDLDGVGLDLVLRVEQETTRVAGATATLRGGDLGELTAELTFTKWNEPVSISAPPPDQIAGG